MKKRKVKSLSKRSRNAQKREAKTPDFSDDQMLSLGSFAGLFLGRRWFDGYFDEESHIPMARLLIGMFNSYQWGVLATKKQAMKFMAAVDARTSQKYIQLAQDRGLLSVTRSQVDKRVYLLIPTEKLLKLVREELSHLGNELCMTAHCLLIDRLPASVQQFQLPEGALQGRYVYSSSGFLIPEDQFQRSRDIALTGKGTDEQTARFSKHRIAQQTELIALIPKNAAAFSMRAHSEKDVGAFADAIADYTEAIRFNPNIADTYTFRAGVYEQIGDYEKAVADYMEAIRLRPNYLHYQNLRDRAVSQLKNKNSKGKEPR